jgi:hypothetical protein
VDAFTLGLWVIRLAFVVLIWIVLLLVVRALWRDLRTTVRIAGTPLARLVVLRSPRGRPEAGTSIPIDAVVTLGRDVNNTVVIDDDRVSAQHALLTYRGRLWLLEDRDTTWGTTLNGEPVQGGAVVGIGDEIGLGEVWLRLERAPIPEATLR